MDIHPVMSERAGEKLKQFFIKMRVNPFTLRDYESLLRKAENSAKNRESDKVTIKDAQIAIDAWLKEKNI